MADALLDTLVPYFIGRLVNLLANQPRESLFEAAGPTLLMMALVLLVLRPLARQRHRLGDQVAFVLPRFDHRLQVD